MTLQGWCNCGRVEAKSQRGLTPLSEGWIDSSELREFGEV